MTLLLYKVTENGITNIVADYQTARRCKENGAHVETFYKELTHREADEFERKMKNPLDK